MLNHNSSVLVHVDRFNAGPSSLISFGCHLAGQLWVEEPDGNHTISIDGEEVSGRLLNTHGQWQTFAAQARHYVSEAIAMPDADEAERYSISLFCPGRLAEVPEEIWLRLERFGFPVDSLKKTHCSELSGPPRVDTEKPGNQRGRRGRAARGHWLAGVALSTSLSSGAGQAPSMTRDLSPPDKHKLGRAGTGNAACMSLDTVWQELLRKRMPSRFLEFLCRGHHCTSRGEELPSQRRETKFLLPCGFPYNPLMRSLAPSSGRRRARWHREKHRRQWVNAAVAYLDWIYLGKPRGSGLEFAAALQEPLSNEQLFLVSELERAYSAVCRPGEVATSPGGGFSLLAKVLDLSSDLGYGGGGLALPRRWV
eukprot:4842953-Amphidinium_carterae.5